MSIKITNDYLKQLEVKQNKTKTTSSDFQNLLEQELKTNQQPKNIATNMAPGTILPLNLQPSNLELNLMQDVDNLLKMWENYSQKLSSEQDSLKEIYGLLQEIQNKINKVKQHPFFAKQPTDLKNLLNEIEIMATTEEIKINRGDYFV
ncbi:MAG: hypothetical protein Q9M37_01365 [Desulfonauticus sp.]|nr:hypothetical protein [Desulfonauticus sp.]